MTLAAGLCLVGWPAARIAAYVCERLADRIVATLVCAAALALIPIELLALVGAGASRVALLGTSLLTTLVLFRFVPGVESSLRRQAADQWNSASWVARAAVLAAVGGLAGWGLGVVHDAGLDNDLITYHLNEVVAWLHNGRPGSVLPVLYQIDSTKPVPAKVIVGNFPLTQEVLTTWVMALSRGFSAATASSAVLLGGFILAAWSALRRIGVAAGVTSAVILAFVLTRVQIEQILGPGTDFPALGWCVMGASLVLASRTSPLAVGPALVATGLAMGTKMTVLPYCLAVVVAIAMIHRHRLSAIAKPVAAGSLTALCVGGPWYIRNWLEHGFPLWPFYAAPWGDPVPFSKLGTFIGHLPETLDRRRLFSYRLRTAGMLPILAGALVAPFFAIRERMVWLVSVATTVSIGLWMTSPFTGLPKLLPPGMSLLYAEFVTLGAIRYLIPALALAAVAVALVGRRRAWFAYAVCGVAVVSSLAEEANAGFPAFPVKFVTGGVLVGVIAGALMRKTLPVRLGRTQIAATVLVCCTGLAVAGSGFLARHERRSKPDAPLVAWLLRQPLFRSTNAPVLSTPFSYAVVAGDQLQHRSETIPMYAPCTDVLRDARGGYVVVFYRGSQETTLELPPERCVGGSRPVFETHELRVYEIPG